MPKSSNRKSHKTKVAQYRRELTEQKNHRQRMLRDLQEKLKAMPTSVGDMLSVEEAKPELLTLEDVAKNGPAVEAADNAEITEVESEEA